MSYTVDELRSRHTVRRYKNTPLTEEIKNSLRSEVTFINTHESGLNFQLVFDNGDPFEGFNKSYGMFSNVNNYLACVIDPTFDNACERAGFFAQQFVMKCVSKQLGACFVGGTYSEKKLDVQKHIYEKIPFVVCFGIPEDKTQTFLSSMAMRMAHRHDLKPRDFFAGDDKVFNEACYKFPFLIPALQGLSCAPSSLNKQPCRISLDNDSNLRMYTTKKDPANAVDLGIGKFNFAEAADAGEWEWGENAIFLPF